MSSKSPNEKKDVQPRKKRKSKRKANSPLIDTEQREQTKGVNVKVNNGLNNGLNNVSNSQSAFYFPTLTPQVSQTIPQNMNFPQQGTFSQSASVYGPPSYPAPSQSPNQMSTFNLPMSQATGPPTWATELMNDVKQIKLSLGKLDQIEQTVNSINTKVIDLESKVKAMENKVGDVEASCSFISAENDDRKKDLSKAKSEIASLKGKCENLEKNTQSYMDKFSAKLEAKVIDLESRSMRENLLFYGIPEGGPEENCENLVKTCAEKLEIHEPHSLVFDRIHRLGNASHNKVRPIVAKFHYFKQREMVRQASYNHSASLKAANLGIGIQWPQQVRDARKTLYPIMQQEKNKGNTAKMVKDKLFVNGIEYVPGQQQQPHH